MIAGCEDTSPRRTGAGIVVALLALLGCGDDPTLVMPVCGTAPPLSFDETAEATLGPPAERLDDAYLDFYTTAIETATVVVIEMTSSEFSPLVHLFDAQGRAVAQAFDRWAVGPPETARLIDSLLPGCYTIAASSWSPGDTGEYSIRITAGAGASDPDVP